MRVSTQQQYLTSIERMQNSQTKLGQLQNQISTGKKYTQPYEDPATAAQSIRLNRELAAIDRYQDNITVATNRLKQEETVLTSMSDQMTALNTLVISAGDPSYNDDNLKTVATEIREIVGLLASEMNTQDVQGEYIFAGNQGFTKPYVLDANNRYVYQGDDGQRNIQVASNLHVASNDSGLSLFEGVTGNLKFAQTGATNIDSTKFRFESDADKEKFETYLKEKVSGDLEFRTTPTGTANNYTFQIVDSTGLQHFPELPTPPMAVTLPETNNNLLNMQGMRFDIALPAASDMNVVGVSTENTVIKSIAVQDQATNKAFFEQYGDVTIRTGPTAPSPGVGQYDLVSSKTGQTISINGVTTFPIPAGGKVSVGGMEVQLQTAPAADGTYKIGPPSKTNSIEAISKVGDVTVANVTNFETFVSTPANAAITGFQVKFGDPAAGQYTIYDQAGAALPAPVTGATLPGPITIAGLSIDTAGALDGDTLTIPLKDDAATTDTFEGVSARTEVVAEKEMINVLNLALDFAEELERFHTTQESRDQLTKARNTALAGMDEAMNRVTNTITSAGARLNTLEKTDGAHEDTKIFTNTTLSGLEDADLAEVASQLKLEELLLQASQQTFATVSRMTLFQYIS